MKKYSTSHPPSETTSLKVMPKVIGALALVAVVVIVVFGNVYSRPIHASSNTKSYEADDYWPKVVQPIISISEKLAGGRYKIDWPWGPGDAVVNSNTVRAYLQGRKHLTWPGKRGKKAIFRLGVHNRSKKQCTDIFNDLKDQNLKFVSPNYIGVYILD